MSLPLWCLALNRSLRVGLGAAFITGLLSILFPNYYRSEARILPVETKSMSGLGSLSSAAAMLGVSVPGSDGADANFVDILNSRPLQEELLKTEYNFNAKSWRFGGDIAHRETLAAFLNVKNMDQGIQSFRGIFTVFRDMKSRVITLGIETSSPELSQQVVAKALQLLEIFVQTKSQTRGGAKAAFAEARLREARLRIGQTEKLFAEFLDSNRNYLTSMDASVKLRGLRLDAEMRMGQQLVTTLTVSHEQALLEEKNDIPILNILEQGNLPIEKSRPARSVYIILVFLLTTGFVFSYERRAFLKASLMGEDD